jgi:hypothetical protein
MWDIAKKDGRHSNGAILGPKMNPLAPALSAEPRPKYLSQIGNFGLFGKSAFASLPLSHIPGWGMRFSSCHYYRWQAEEKLEFQILQAGILNSNFDLLILKTIISRLKHKLSAASIFLDLLSINFKSVNGKKHERKIYTL